MPFTLLFQRRLLNYKWSGTYTQYLHTHLHHCHHAERGPHTAGGEKWMKMKPRCRRCPLLRSHQNPSDNLLIWYLANVGLKRLLNPAVHTQKCALVFHCCCFRPLQNNVSMFFSSKRKIRSRFNDLTLNFEQIQCPTGDPQRSDRFYHSIFC